MDCILHGVVYRATFLLATPFHGCPFTKYLHIHMNIPCVGSSGYEEEDEKREWTPPPIPMDKDNDSGLYFRLQYFGARFDGICARSIARKYYFAAISSGYRHRQAVGSGYSTFTWMGIIIIIIILLVLNSGWIVDNDDAEGLLFLIPQLHRPHPPAHVPLSLCVIGCRWRCPRCNTRHRSMSLSLSQSRVFL